MSPRGHNTFWGQKTSIMKSAPSNYSEGANFQPKTLKTVNFDQKFFISEFSRHIEHDFLKEDHRTTSIPKIRKIDSGVWKL